MGAGTLRQRQIAVAMLAAAMGFGASRTEAGFRSEQSLVQNLFAYYGRGSGEYSAGLPRDAATARQFFHPALARLWLDPSPRPFDFIVQATSWKIGPVAITGTIRHYDRTYLRVAFQNRDKPIVLDLVIVKDDDGWVIADIDSSYDSLAAFLTRIRGQDLPSLVSTPAAKD
jgi:hypothetical protein